MKIAVYQGKKVVLTTKHEKEKIIARPFLKGLGIKVIAANSIDTDLLGTFTGEIPRIGSMKEVIIKKARLGMEELGLPYGLASEGSFGPHPYLPFFSSNTEMLIFIDDVHDFIIVEQLLTQKTNFSYIEINNTEIPAEFLKKIGFPKHGIIVKPKTKQKNTKIFKGIQSIETLSDALKICRNFTDEGIIHLETDMRAHMNPTRCQVIRALSFKLVRRLQQYCPGCNFPGWGLIDIEKGLPCIRCAAPTDLVDNELWGCVKCEYKQHKKRADGLTHADIQYCPVCNP